MERLDTPMKPGAWLKKLVRQQIFIPLAALLILVIFNLIADPGFFKITMGQNSNGDPVLSGYLITILNNASELVILAIGMTLVTSASGGQDISVGAAIAIAGSVILRVLCGTEARPETMQAPIIVAFLVACVVAMLFGAFNGALVAYFKIQPMVATLILFTAGRSIAAWINNNELPIINDPSFGYFGNFIPGIPIPTPVFIAVACMIVIALALKFTTLGRLCQVPDLCGAGSVRGGGGAHQGQPHLHHQLFRHCQGHRDGRHFGGGPGRQCPQRRQVQHGGLHSGRLRHSVPDHDPVQVQRGL